MDTPIIEAKTRTEEETAKIIRRQGLIPAVFYGKGVDNQHINLEYEAFRKVYKTAGENTIIDLNIDGKKSVKVLVHNIQVDPEYDRFIHVDFINIKMDEEITAMIPIILEGLAPAVKDLGGTLVQSLDEVEVKCLPADLPHEIKGNVDLLIDFNTSLHVSDLVKPDKVEITSDPEQTVATVAAQQEEKEEEPVVEEGAEGAAEGETKEGEAKSDEKSEDSK